MADALKTAKLAFGRTGAILARIASGQGVFASTLVGEAAGMVRKTARLPMPVRTKALYSPTPTITTAAFTTSSGYAFLPWKSFAQPIGFRPVFSAVGNALSTPVTMCGFETFFVGQVLNVRWRCGDTNTEKVQIFVDGFPVYAAPTAVGIATTFNSDYLLTIDFGSSARRRVEVLMTGTARLTGFISVGDSVAATPKRRVVMPWGDSFFAGSTAVTRDQLPNAYMMLRYEVNAIPNAFGGTGYITDGAFTRFGSPTRLAIAQDVQPDDIIFMGSVNDSVADPALVASTASTVWAAAKAVCPDAVIVILGVQPTSSDTVSTGRFAVNAALNAAATAAGYTFYDMIGNGFNLTVPAYSTGNTYNAGDLTVYRNSVWRMDGDAAWSPGVVTNAPGGSGGQRWTLMTYDYYGTGRVGSTTGDGTRDILLFSDGIHPTAPACENLAYRGIAAISLNK